jgi:hypothetical protein
MSGIHGSCSLYTPYTANTAHTPNINAQQGTHCSAYMPPHAPGHSAVHCTWSTHMVYHTCSTIIHITYQALAIVHCPLPGPSCIPPTVARNPPVHITISQTHDNEMQPHHLHIGSSTAQRTHIHTHTHTHRITLICQANKSHMTPSYTAAHPQGTLAH